MELNQSDLECINSNNNNKHHKKIIVKNYKLYSQIQEIKQIILINRNNENQSRFSYFSFFMGYLLGIINRNHNHSNNKDKHNININDNKFKDKKKDQKQIYSKKNNKQLQQIRNLQAGSQVVCIIPEKKQQIRVENDKQQINQRMQIIQRKNQDHDENQNHQLQKNSFYIIISQKIKQLCILQKDMAITNQNIIQLFSYLRIKSIQNKKNSFEYLIQLMDQVITQLVIDNQYIRRIYLSEENQFQKLQKRKSKDKNSRLNLMIKQKEKLGIQCLICSTDIQHLNLSLLSCGHCFHKTCFGKYTELKIIEKSFPILCPNKQCKTSVSINDIQEQVQREILQKFYDFTFNTYVEKNVGNTTWCPTFGCTSVFSFDQMLKEYKCPACKISFCLKCKCQMHSGLTCRQYRAINKFQEDDKAFKQFSKGLKFKQCPKCRFWVQKYKGSNQMICRCKFQFCSKCGKAYGTCDCIKSDYNNQQKNFQQPYQLPIPMQIENPSQMQLVRVSNLSEQQAMNHAQNSSEIQVARVPLVQIEIQRESQQIQEQNLQQPIKQKSNSDSSQSNIIEQNLQIYDSQLKSDFKQKNSKERSEQIDQFDKKSKENKNLKNKKYKDKSDFTNNKFKNNSSILDKKRRTHSDFIQKKYQFEYKSNYKEKQQKQKSDLRDKNQNQKKSDVIVQ